MPPLYASFNKPTGKYCILHGLFLFSLDMSIWSYSNAYVDFFILSLYRMQRLPPSGGRGKLLSNDQELAIVEMVVANNEIKLHEIQTRIVADHEIFDNIGSISLTTITRTLSKHRVRMKQLYTVPFERNSERVKELRRQYVQVWCIFNSMSSSISFALCK